MTPTTVNMASHQANDPYLGLIYDSFARDSIKTSKNQMAGKDAKRKLCGYSDMTCSSEITYFIFTTILNPQSASSSLLFIHTAYYANCTVNLVT
ncbi:unnamed protein product [Dibothriocephalus latus]|uniref:Uncharacterized protein n=1 Tax=Dibothriocephalus latus TaxID=60516 RepID=A0A3P7NR13_DIBLA|nr:unnamed protein product [Dibothriocephalus latus]